MALVDITIIRPDGTTFRIPHLVKHETSEDEDSGVTETYDEDIPEEGSIKRGLSTSGIIVAGDGYPTETELRAMTSNVPGGYQLVAIDHQIKTKYTYGGVMRTSWKNGRDGKKRPTRDLEFSATSLETEDV
ncbi:hypothetical protein MBCUT_06860 [Methanobrevibacter cuticularis]|uniref:Uncharacterized protein n=1 Tax=Methanobrevibacter cuticularis TaxID=47311 RepID=A0A166EH18_9EURY|nr:hypothetical protein [Methanobrevibacter cuticularis]KZX16648.1 hypothetical protein MBCUT_06860 [Methanobrevibacter cuticularis]